MTGESDASGRRQYPGREQRLGHPFGVAAIPPRPFRAAGLSSEMGLDLARSGWPELGHRGDDVVGQLRVLLDDVRAPSPVPVLAHAPAEQWPVVDGHQRGLVRPVLDQQSR